MDTKTSPIVPGLGNPPCAALQYKIDDGPVVVVPARADRAKFCQAVRLVLSAPRLVAHNGAYDAAVLCREGFDEEVFEAYDSGRFEDTLQTSRLLDIAHGRGLRRPYDLRSVCEAWGCSVVPDKDDPVRTRYWEVAAIPFAEWPEEFKSYATTDVEALAELDQLQEEQRVALVHKPGW